jgi:DNA-binding transcriptional LysR family regulator
MDRLTSLTVFTRVVECSGFSAAARRLNMSTTMVSSHVQALEDRLGARLLNRTTRKVSLTEVGKAYYERCTKILAELEQADQIAGALQSTPRGTLRLHTGTHLMRFVAPVVAEFLALYPEASVNLTMGERIVDLIEEGIDLVIRHTVMPDSSLIVRHLTTWRPVLCCSPRYLEANEAPRTVADLAQHNCLRYAYYAFGDEWRFTSPDGRPTSVRVSGNLLASSGETLRVAALRGLGVFLGPGFVIGDDLEAGRLIPILTAYRPVEFSINAIYPHRHRLSAKVRTFIDLLAARIVEHRRWINPDIGPSAKSARDKQGRGSPASKGKP